MLRFLLGFWQQRRSDEWCHSHQESMLLLPLWSIRVLVGLEALIVLLGWPNHCDHGVWTPISINRIVKLCRKESDSKNFLTSLSHLWSAFQQRRRVFFRHYNFSGIPPYIRMRLNCLAWNLFFNQKGKRKDTERKSYKSRCVWYILLKSSPARVEFTAYLALGWISYSYNRNLLFLLQSSRKWRRWSH